MRTGSTHQASFGSAGRMRRGRRLPEGPGVVGRPASAGDGPARMRRPARFIIGSSHHSPGGCFIAGWSRPGAAWPTRSRRFDVTPAPCLAPDRMPGRGGGPARRRTVRTAASAKLGRDDAGRRPHGMSCPGTREEKRTGASSALMDRNSAGAARPPAHPADRPPYGWVGAEATRRNRIPTRSDADGWRAARDWPVRDRRHGTREPAVPGGRGIMDATRRPPSGPGGAVAFRSGGTRCGGAQA